MKLEIYDSTLREGEQSATVTFTWEDRLKIIGELDRLGISCIETGMLTCSRDLEFLHQAAALDLSHASLSAFGATRRAGERAEESEGLALLADAPVSTVCIFGKSWGYQVENVLRTTKEENLAMIRDSVAFLTGAGKRVIFDAEHFFDGYSDDADYALSALRTAWEAGADTVVLCDTNGGMLPDVIGMATGAATAAAREASRSTGHACHVGIHCHNDMGMAEACSVSAVLSGAVHVQGTISGIGERCGNANLNTLIPVLQLKLGFACIGERLALLTDTARRINEFANRAFDEREPFVGGYAFTHKAGTHIDGVIKSPRSFEHISPGSVGNMRNMIISSLSGRSAMVEKMARILPQLDRESPKVAAALEAVRCREEAGYSYDDAEASLLLVIREALGMRRQYFQVPHFKVMTDEGSGKEENMRSTAMIKVEVGGAQELCAAEGIGPVNAMDKALRQALVRFYPAIDQMHLTDFKVRVISGGATAAVVRVVIESTDGVTVWRTVGVSPDVISASWQALRDSVEYMLELRCGEMSVQLSKECHGSP